MNTLATTPLNLTHLASTVASASSADARAWKPGQQQAYADEVARVVAARTSPPTRPELRLILRAVAMRQRLAPFMATMVWEKLLPTVVAPAMKQAATRLAGPLDAPNIDHAMDLAERFLQRHGAMDGVRAVNDALSPELKALPPAQRMQVQRALTRVLAELPFEVDAPALPAAQHAALENLESSLAWSKEPGDVSRAAQLRAAAVSALGLAPLSFEAAFTHYLNVAGVPTREHGAGAGSPEASLLGMPRWQGPHLTGSEATYSPHDILAPYGRRAEVQALRGRQVRIEEGTLAAVRPGYFGASDDKTEVSLVADARGVLFRGNNEVLGERALAAASVRLGRGRRITAVTGFSVGAYKAGDVHAAAALLMLAANGLDLKRVKMDARWFAGDLKGSAHDALVQLQPKILADRTVPQTLREAVRLAVGSFLNARPTAPIVGPMDPLPYVPVVVADPKPPVRFAREIMSWLNAKAAPIGAAIGTPVEPLLRMLADADTVSQPAVMGELLREAGLNSRGVEVLTGLVDVLEWCRQGAPMLDALIERAQTGVPPRTSSNVPFEAIVRFERAFLAEPVRAQLRAHVDAASIPLRARDAVLDAFELAYVATRSDLLAVTVAPHTAAAQQAIAAALVDQLKRELAALDVSPSAAAQLADFLAVGAPAGPVRDHVRAVVNVLGDAVWGRPLPHHVHRDALRPSSTTPLTEAQRHAQAAPHHAGAFLPHAELTQRDGADAGAIVLAQNASCVAYKSLHASSAVLPAAQAVASINIELDSTGRPVKLTESSAKYDVPPHRTALMMLHMLADGFAIADLPMTTYTHPQFEFMQVAKPYGSFSVRDFLEVTAQQLATPRSIEESLVAQVLARRSDLMPPHRGRRASTPNPARV